MLKNVIGQDKAKQILTLLSQGYKRRGYLPPVGVFGPSGLGKSHLVASWAGEIGAKTIYVNGTSVKDSLAFRKFFEDARKDQQNHFIFFVDECHGLPRKVQDNLLSVLEQPAILCTVAPKDVGWVGTVDGPKYIDKGDIIRESLPNNMSFALATTDPAKLKDPVLNRLRKVYLAQYSTNEKIEIAMRHLGQSGVRSDMVIYKALAERSRSIRHLKSELCETYLDIRSLYHDDPQQSMSMLDDILGIDSDGASSTDIDYLEYLVDNKTVGLDTMAGYLQVEKQELVKNIEPFLLQKGWIAITGKGRKLTPAGFHKLGVTL